MAISGTVIHDLKGLETRIRLHPKELLAADLRARNRTASSSRTHATRLLRPLLGGLKAATIRRRLRVERATPAKTSASLSFSEKRINVLKFGDLSLFRTRFGLGARLRRMPYRLELADGTPVTADQVLRMFPQRGPSGRANVFVREGKLRNPIQVVLIPSPSQAFREQGVGRETIIYGRQRMRQFLAQEMKYRISRRLSRGG